MLQYWCSRLSGYVSLIISATGYALTYAPQVLPLLPSSFKSTAGAVLLAVGIVHGVCSGSILPFLKSLPSSVSGKNPTATS